MTTSPPPVPKAPLQLANTSLTLGIIGICTCLGFVVGIPGAICGHRASNQTKSDPGSPARKRATAGLITSYIAIALLPLQIGFWAALIIPSMLNARNRAGEMACHANIAMIAAAKQAHQQAHSGQTPASLEELLKDGLLTSVPTCPSRQGGEYDIGGQDENPTCSTHGDLIANPPGSKRMPPRGESAVEK